MEKQAAPARGSIKRIAPALGLGFLLLLAGTISAIIAQTAQPPAGEEQRGGSQAETFERQDELQNPNLAPPVATPDDATVDGIQTPILPTESSCYTLHHFVPDVPSQRPLAHQSAGASGFPLTPFRFSQDYLHQSVGVCIGKEDLHPTYQY